MNIITRGFGTNSSIITRGYGIAKKVAQVVTSFVKTNTIVKIRQYAMSIINGRHV